MRAVLRSIHLDPDPRTLPGDATNFAFLARLCVGPSDGPGEESFDVQVCSPQWLAARCANEGFVDGHHTVVTRLDGYSEQGLRSFLTRRVENVRGATWRDVAEKVARLGLWEFEDYRE